MTEQMERRLQVESPYMRKEKEVQKRMEAMRKLFPLKPVAYMVEFFDENHNSIGKRKFRVSKGFPLRLPELVKTYPYFLEVQAVYETKNDMYAVEKCVENGLSASKKPFLDQEATTAPIEKLKFMIATSDRDLSPRKRANSFLF